MLYYFELKIRLGNDARAMSSDDETFQECENDFATEEAAELKNEHEFQTPNVPLKSADSPTHQTFRECKNDFDAEEVPEMRNEHEFKTPVVPSKSNVVPAQHQFTVDDDEFASPGCEFNFINILKYSKVSTL